MRAGEKFEFCVTNDIIEHPKIDEVDSDGVVIKDYRVVQVDANNKEATISVACEFTYCVTVSGRDPESRFSNPRKATALEFVTFSRVVTVTCIFDDANPDDVEFAPAIIPDIGVDFEVDSINLDIEEEEEREYYDFDAYDPELY